MTELSLTPLTLSALSVSPVSPGSASVIGPSEVGDVPVWDGSGWDFLHSVIDVRSYGAVGDGVTDDTAAVQAALDASAGGGSVRFPSGFQFAISAALDPPAKTRLFGEGYPLSLAPNDVPPSLIKAAVGYDGPLIDTASKEVLVERLGFRGTDQSGSKGIRAEDAENWVIRDCVFAQFGDQAIEILDGNCAHLENIWAQNSLLVRTGRSDYIGVIDVAGNDHTFIHVNSSSSSSIEGDISADGFVCAIVVRCSSSFFFATVGQISDHGIVVDASAAVANRFVACRADLNYGHGFLLATGNNNDFTSCFSYRNGRAADNTYDAFKVETAANTFIGNRVGGATADTNHTQHGFNDSSTLNTYLANRNHGALDGSLYNFTAGGSAGTPVVAGSVALTYGTTIATDCRLGETFRVVATNTTNFAFAAPTNPVAGQRITYDIKNSSGGALGTVTWNAVFLLAGAFTNPADTKRRTISFFYDGTNWVETGRAAADI